MIIELINENVKPILIKTKNYQNKKKIYFAWLFWVKSIT